MHAICLQIFLQSLFRIFPHASCVHIFRDISGKYSKIHKGFSPFFPSSLKKSDDAICIRVTIPVEWEYTIPYGILYAVHPPEDVAELIALVKEQL